MMTTKILLNGCNGRMGRMFTRVASKYPDIEIAAGTDVAPPGAAAYEAPPAYPTFICASQDDIGADTSNAISAVVPDEIVFDAIVDFSHYSALGAVLDLALKRKSPVLLCTTGYSEAQSAEIDAAAAKIPVFQSANMSVGVSVLSELIKKAASVLSEGYDVEIVEAHHNQKIDAPSGTALMLADAVNEGAGGGREYVYERHSVRAKRGKGEIGIHSIRGGTIVGEHSVIFAGPDEVLEIKHSAASREIFAEGAVRAVRFLTSGGRAAGRYSMKDLVRGT